MGLYKEERTIRVMRLFKTLFFLITMLISLLFFSAQILLVIADTLLPSALLSASLSFQNISSHLSNYDFRYSLIDIPLISIIRSAVILCVYSLCDGRRLSRGPYLEVATICSVCSLVFVSLKACYVFGDSWNSMNYMEISLFFCSWTLAVAHVVVAYRISCRERRKLLLVYNIDIEAVSACKTGSFPRYPKVLQDERMK
ncbi:uncharacterized protein LOC132054381 [Lycium ferocissimum]|uniref:uncharacterized protein LOC132054381 n=1 Tax=Lycium ferocissimum TaxID=112874 RepID=UPI002814B15B|nr:uncharacterized protein LOC132054381 [Lycium ferocissimum]